MFIIYPQRYLLFFHNLQPRPVVDLGEGPGPPLFLDQTEPRKAQKNFSGDPPVYLRVWMTASHPRSLCQGLDPALRLMLYLVYLVCKPLLSDLC